MTGLTTTARCLRCDWVPVPGDWAAVDRQAEKHTRKAGHPTAVTTIPREKPTAREGMTG